MAAKTIQEVIDRCEVTALIKIAVCVGPMSELVQRLDNTGLEIEKRFRNEMRDFLAHEVARFCRKHDAMKHYDILTQFIQEVVKDIPACGGDK